jgi:hypothetical protein
MLPILFNDSPSGTTYFVTINDSIYVDDSIIRSVSAYRSIADSVMAYSSAVATKIVVVYVFLSDSISISDSISRIQSLFRTIIDAVTPSDF